MPLTYLRLQFEYLDIIVVYVCCLKWCAFYLPLIAIIIVYKAFNCLLITTVRITRPLSKLPVFSNAGMFIF